MANLDGLDRTMNRIAFGALLTAFLVGAGAGWCTGEAARGQDIPLTTTQGLTEAILDMTTTERRWLRWRPCGDSFQGRDPEARVYATNIAAALEEAAGDDLDPWWMAAQLMQESGMNPCALSSGARAALEADLGRRATPRDISRVLRHPQRRRDLGFQAADVGLAQFRWPGTAARRAGITAPEQLLDPNIALPAFAASLRRYKTACEHTPVFRITTTNDAGRVRRHRLACEDYFWAIHNTGSASRIRIQYIRNVRRRYSKGPERWRARVERSPDLGGV